MTVLRGAGAWQLVLADLALILFMVTLSALAGSLPSSLEGQEVQTARPAIAPSQAVFRPDPLGPSLSQWLSVQGRDPRLTLTVFAQSLPGEAQLAFDQASALAREAQASGWRARIIVSEGETRDLHASLAYDLGP